ncbi:unnamed protein product [Symbiodinium sp. CCMP2592]|nr:unnamed protein product [Symbiodinium sp. CCMP2592]
MKDAEPTTKRKAAANDTITSTYEAALKKLKKPELEKKLSATPALPEHIIPGKLKKDQLIAELLKVHAGCSANHKISAMFGAGVAGAKGKE